MKTKFCSLVFALFLLGAALARADLHLAFGLTEDVDVPAQNDGKIPATHTSNQQHIEVFLGDGYMDVQSDEGRAMFDFTGQKIFTLSSKDKTYAITSLYAVIGFRAMELQNRVFIAGTLNAAGVKDIPEGEAYAENELSLRLPNSPPLPTPTTSGNTLTYSYNGKPLFSRPSDGQKLSASEAAQLVRFIRYQFGLHPDILDAWQKEATLPGHFDIYQYNTENTHLQFALLRLDRMEHKFTPLAELTGFKETDDPLAVLCAKANALDQAQFTASCNALKNTAVTEAKAGHNLDAVLFFLAYTLATGQQMPPEFSTYRDVLTNDADATLLIKSMTPHSEEEAKSDLTALRSLEGKANSGKIFLNIFEADILDPLGQPDDAIKLFQAVLAEYPCLVGPWNDVGEIYYRRFESVSAWQCWGAGRHLLPTHPLFKDVDDLEESLRKEHPEYFN